MADFEFAPQYRLYLKRGDGTVWSLRTLQSARCTLTTGQGAVAQGSFILADTEGFLRTQVDVHAMNLLQLWSSSRFGHSQICWTGYVDERHELFDTEAGSHVTLSATGPIKKFEVVRQSPGDVAALALAFARNVRGSSVLEYAAQACGYPRSMLKIHPVADAGSGLQQLGTGPFSQPDQQLWASVVSGVQANTGTEWFTTANGDMYWRQLNFLQPWFPRDSTRPRTQRPYTIGLDDVVQADFCESDAGVVSGVQVRWGSQGGYLATAAHYPPLGHANAGQIALAKHLGTRRLVVYAPWLFSKDAAQYLAEVLYNQYSASIATATLTIPADPLIGLGSLVDVPAVGRSNSTTRYYVQAIDWDLNWGGRWDMVLHLSYGRAPDQTFAYGEKFSWPVVTAAVREGSPRPGGIDTLDQTNLNWDLQPYSIVAQAGLVGDQAATDAFAAGVVIQIYSRPRSHGHLVGPAKLGEYTVVAAQDPSQAATSIALAQTAYSTGYVTIINPDPSSSDSSDPSSTGGPLHQSSGTGHPQGAVTDPGPAVYGPAATTPLRALALAKTLAGKPYVPTNAGEKAWDCSGLCAWVYAQLGIGTASGEMFVKDAWGPGVNGDTAPNGIYNFMVRLGATQIAVSDAEAGDLLFCVNDNPDWIGQQGFSHVAFALGGGKNFGANPPIGISDIAGFTSDGGAPFNKALSLSSITNWPSSQ